METPESPQAVKNEVVIPAEPVPKVKITATIVPPKAEKKEKKPRTEAQQAHLLKMREARKTKAATAAAAVKAAEEAEKKNREDAVRKAEEEAKKIADTVVVQKVRGRKTGSKNKVIEKPVYEASKPMKPEEPPQQLSHHDYSVMMLRQRGVSLPENVSPYYLKMLTSRRY
jgi:hypothetical protein